MTDAATYADLAVINLQRWAKRGRIFMAFWVVFTLPSAVSVMQTGRAPANYAIARGIVGRMNVQHGVTFVIVTHDTELAAKTDRVIRLKDGKVVSDQTTVQEAVAV